MYRIIYVVRVDFLAKDSTETVITEKSATIHKTANGSFINPLQPKVIDRLRFHNAVIKTLLSWLKYPLLYIKEQHGV